MSPPSPNPPLFRAPSGIRAYGFPHTPDGAAGGLTVTAAALTFQAGGTDAGAVPPPSVIPMESLILHAVCRDTSAFAHPCLYIQLDGEADGGDAADGGEVRLVVDADAAAGGGGSGGGGGGPSTDAGGDGAAGGEGGGGGLDALFAAVSAAASVAFAADAADGDGGGGDGGGDAGWGGDFFTAPAGGGATGGAPGVDAGLASALGGVPLPVAAQFEDAEEAGGQD